MEILYRLRCATAREVMSEAEGQQAYSTVRTQLRVLERKGFVHRGALRGVYVYRPVIPASQARRAALWRVIDTFFGGSPVRRCGVPVVDPPIPSAPPSA
jgi:BlaI family penicillinase repressor